MIGLLLAAVLLGGNPSVRPWPIGPGPRYTPPAAPAAVAAGAPLGPLACTGAGPVIRVHLELYADRRVIVVPAGIGVAEPSARQNGEVAPHGCTYAARTLTPTGVVEIARGAQLRLADFFRIWGQPLAERRLASFSSPTPVRAYVGGRLVRGPVGAIPLRPGAEIVLELGRYVPPHPFFLFAGAAA